MKKNNWKNVAFIIILITLVFIVVNFKTSTEVQDISEIVIPSEGVELPILWGDLGTQMVEAGVIDRKYKDVESLKEFIFEEVEGKVVITRDNARAFLNALWAFGLSNENSILTDGEMTSPLYGGDPSRFASTGGWTLSVGNPMDHYSKHAFVTLTPDELKMVENVSRGIYRPCCDNSTHFPDCNHGIAMLGLLQLLASSGLSEDQMYEVALTVNSYWFPDTYLTLASYFKSKNKDWDPKIVLGIDYSSASGYQKVLKEINPVQLQNSASCSV